MAHRSMKTDLPGFEVAVGRFSFSRQVRAITLHFFQQPRILWRENNPAPGAWSASFLRAPRHHLLVSRAGEIWVGLNWNKATQMKRRPVEDVPLSFILAVGADPGSPRLGLTDSAVSACARAVAVLQSRFELPGIEPVQLVQNFDRPSAADIESVLGEIQTAAMNNTVERTEDIYDMLSKRIPFELDALEMEEGAERILAFLSARPR